MKSKHIIVGFLLSFLICPQFLLAQSLGRDLAITLSKEFRKNYKSSIVDNEKLKIAIIESTEFMKYSINLYHEEFIRYLSESDIKRILKSRRYTEEEMALKEQADVKLNVAILSTVADVYRENYFYQRTLERDKEIDEKLRKRKRPAP